jgi:3-hydroxyacyl-CoA dehydrogenase
MATDDLPTVGLVGGGSIGVAWAIVFARSGRHVVVFDPEASRRQRIRSEVGRRLEALASFDLIDEDVEGIIDRVLVVGELASAVESAEYVQESGPENVELKRQIFREIENFAPPTAVIASSSSAIVCSDIAADLVSRDRCLIVHPGNPPYLLPVAEVVPAPFTSEAVTRRAMDLLEQVGMSPVRVRREIEGFVFNRLQGAVLREAYCLVRDGVISATDLDRVMRDGLGRRWAVVGPFATSHLNVAGGIPAHAQRMASSYARMGEERGQDDPWTPELVSTVAAELERMLPTGDWERFVEERDLAMMVLARARRSMREVGE